MKRIVPPPEHAVLPIRLFLAAETDGDGFRRWHIFPLPVIAVTAQQVWLQTPRTDPLPASRIARGYLLEAGPWSPTLWIGPDPKALALAASRSWDEQRDVAERRALRLRELLLLIGAV